MIWHPTERFLKRKKRREREREISLKKGEKEIEESLWISCHDAKKGVTPGRERERGAKKREAQGSKRALFYLPPEGSRRSKSKNTIAAAFLERQRKGEDGVPARSQLRGSQLRRRLVALQPHRHPQGFPPFLPSPYSLPPSFLSHQSDWVNIFLLASGREVNSSSFFRSSVNRH